MDTGMYSKDHWVEEYNIQRKFLEGKVAEWNDENIVIMVRTTPSIQMVMINWNRLAFMYMVSVIAHHFLKEVEIINEIAIKIREDLVSENFQYGVQKFFWRNDNGELFDSRSFLYGKSTLNKYIES